MYTSLRVCSPSDTGRLLATYGFIPRSSTAEERAEVEFDRREEIDNRKRQAKAKPNSNWYLYSYEHRHLKAFLADVASLPGFVPEIDLTGQLFGWIDDAVRIGIETPPVVNNSEGVTDETAMIVCLYVKKANRGYGLATQTLRTLQAIADKHGITLVGVAQQYETRGPETTQGIDSDLVYRGDEYDSSWKAYLCKYLGFVHRENSHTKFAVEYKPQAVSK